MCNYCVSKNLTEGQRNGFHSILAEYTRVLRQKRKSDVQFYASTYVDHVFAPHFEQILARIDACEELLHRGEVETGL
jgi:hypothetical protein